MLIVTTKPLDDARLQELFTSTIDGAMASGYQNVRRPPDGHWLMRWWQIGRDIGVRNENDIAHHKNLMAELDKVQARLAAMPRGVGSSSNDQPGEQR